MGNKSLIRLVLLLLFLFGAARGGWAQGQLDSLEKYARKYYQTNLDSSRYFGRQLGILAKEMGNHEKVAFSKNWIAITFLRKGMSDSVAYYLDDCIAYCEAHDVPLIKAKARLNQSINHYQQGKFEEASTMGLDAIRFFEAQDDSLGTAHALYNTGLSFQRTNREDEALQFFERAYVTYRVKGSEFDRAITLNAIGVVWDNRNNLDSALVYYHKAVQVKTEGGYAHLCGSEYTNIAAILEKKGQHKEAERYYLQSFQVNQNFGDLRGTATAAANLAFFMNNREKWDSALYYANFALSFADSTADQFLLSVSHTRLAESYEGMGKYELALLHHKLTDSIKTIMSGAEVQKNMDELHIQYQTEKKERELMKVRLANQRKNFWLFGTLAGTAGLLIAFLLIVRSEREKKRRLVETARADLEGERNRISMDLHDHLGAELSIISSQLDTQAFKAKEVDLQEKLEVLAEQARGANAMLRETIWSVRSTEVELQQFCQKVREFAERSLQGSDIRFACDCKGALTLNPAKALELFRVLQEGITNARKHSSANLIRLDVRLEEKELLLILSDNGQGFAEAAVKPGYGLSNMRDRVSKLGGKLELKSGEGTTLSLRIPLKA